MYGLRVLALMLAVSAVPTATGFAETHLAQVTGRVTLVGRLPVPIAYTPTKEPDVCGTAPQSSDEVVVAAEGAVRYAVVSLSGMGPSGRAAQMSVTLDQKRCRFEPHVVLIPAGATLEILNSDNTLHNVRTTSKKNPPFNKAQPKAVKKIKQIFNAAPERIKVQCDAHSWMSAWIIVQENPYYAITDAQGQFTLNNVAPGEYTLTYWHERFGEQTSRITVPHAGTVSVDLIFHAK